MIVSLISNNNITICIKRCLLANINQNIHQIQILILIKHFLYMRVDTHNKYISSKCMYRIIKAHGISFSLYL